MNVTKYLHSCLLVEDQDKTILIDPDVFTYQEKVFDITKVNKLDFILITHVHPDHCFPPFIKELTTKFPDATIISNQQVVDLLSKEGINATTEETEFIAMETIPHEKLWDTEPPENTIFKVFNRLTHPGDSLHFNTSSEILALPIQAPWGSTVAAVEKALEMKPKIIIPIHDWHWKDVVRKGMYERLTTFFASKEIIFKGIDTGETITV